MPKSKYLTPEQIAAMKYPIPADGKCLCGCGQITEIATQSATRYSWIKGQHKPFVQYHSNVTREADLKYKPPLDGLCLCGCGTTTEIATMNMAFNCWIKGKHKPFFEQHRQRFENGPSFIVDPDTGCHIWAKHIHAQSGYGIIGRNGRLYQAHVYFYEQQVGPITKGMHLDHLCRNRACVNVTHLEMVTPTENIRRGDATKLTKEQAIEIMSLRGSNTANELAQRYGVHPGAIYSVWWKHTWADITPDVAYKKHCKRSGNNGAHTKITKEQVVQIRAMSAAGSTANEIAKVFDLNWQHISRIIARRVWKDIS